MHFSLHLVLLLATLPATPPQWPQFRGPNGSGLALDSDQPPIHFGPESNCLWKVTTPAGPSSPCVWKDHIFLTAFDEGQLKTLCYRRSDGKLLWQKIAPAEEIEKFHPKEGSPASGTPATDGANVYVYFGSCGLFCYNVAGEQQWHLPLPVAKSSGDFGSGASPILAGDFVILNRDQQEDSCLLAVDKQTGRVTWRADRPGFLSSYGTPILWEHDTQREIVLAGFLQMVAYDLASGQQRWSVMGLPTAVCTTPVLGDNLLFFAGWSPGQSDAPLPSFSDLLPENDKNGDGIININEATERIRSFFSSYDTNRDQQLTEAEWTAFKRLLGRGQNALLAVKPGGHGDITETHVAWKQLRGLPYCPSPLYYRGRVYLVKDGGLASCYQAADGKPLYQQERLGTTGTYYASPVAADGHIYVVAASGAGTVLAAGDELKVEARFDLGNRTMATPAIVGNALYIRTDSHLFAFGTD